MLCSRNVYFLQFPWLCGPYLYTIYMRLLFYSIFYFYIRYSESDYRVLTKFKCVETDNFMWSRQTIACCQQMILKRPQYTGLVKFFKLFSHIVLRRGVMSEIYPYWRRLLHTSFSLVYTSFYITVVFRAKRRYFRTKIIEDDMFTRKDKRPGGRGCMDVYLNDKCRQVYMISSLFTPETPFW